MTKTMQKGMLLESVIKKMNERYEEAGYASFKKIPNNWSVQRKGPHIVGAKPIPSGLCDYVGTSKYVKGRAVVFDAKECKQKTRFPLTYIKHQQMDHMREVTDHGGLAFVLVWFTELHEYYCLPYVFIVPYWDASESEDGVKHIPIQDIREKAFELDDEPDYLEYIMKAHQNDVS